MHKGIVIASKYIGLSISKCPFSCQPKSFSLFKISHVFLSFFLQDSDHEARIEEAITRTMICAIKASENPSDTDSWLNPTEVFLFILSSKVFVHFCLNDIIVNCQSLPQLYAARISISRMTKHEYLWLFHLTLDLVLSQKCNIGAD